MMKKSNCLTSKESFAILREIESRRYTGGVSLSEWTVQVQ